MEKFYKCWKKFGENFQQGGKLEKLSSFYDAFDTFLFTPTTTAKKVGAQIHDGSDSKRTMIIVVLALIPCALFGMFNVGYQHLLATGQLAMGMTCGLWWKALGFGVLAVLPLYLVSYIVGLGIEFIGAQIKHEEVAEGYLVTGFILPLI
ncbi:MAG: RnfABCDGE type electron transport complex subunit D, partial [Bacteroidales bacterium]|nr:RnfABCDGE type electron transport complex subunit D [Bacteroidales bacterium]